MFRVSLLPVLLGLGLFALPAGLAAQDHRPDRPVTPLCVTGCPATVSVTPDSGSVGVEANSGSHTVTFFVTNTGTTSGSYTLTCSAVKVTCGTVTPSAVTLPANGTIDVDVSFTVGSRGGTVTLTASGSATDAGMYAVAIVAPSAPVVALPNQNGTNLDRGLCLTTGAGEAAGLSCGDLFVIHGMPAYRTLGRDRALSLLYNSATATGLVLVAAQVTQPGGTALPTSVTLVLTVGAAKDSAQFAAVPPGQTQQMVVGRGLTGLATGVYPMTLAVRNGYPGGAYETTVSGTVLVVNRSVSEFGAGWALLGLEQVLTDPADSTRRVWVAGDGSIRLYTQTFPGSNAFLGAAGEAPDSLVRFDTLGTEHWYRRTLKHGVAVTFDATGRHRSTTNRVGAITSFYWSSTSPVRLDSITVPPNDAIRRTYRLFWHGGTALLDSIRDPGGRRLGLLLDGTGQLTRLTDPDNQATRFQYTGGRLTRRVSPRVGMKGDSAFTNYAYANSARVTAVSIQTDSAATLFAVTTLTPWDERGLAQPYGTTSSGAATSSAGLPTRIDGPLSGTGDASDILVNRFGQPSQITQLGLNTATTIAYDSLSLPALPTRIQFPHAANPGAGGRIVRMTWNARGNLAEQRDSTMFLDGQPTKVTSYSYTSGYAPDSPSSVQDVLGRHTDYIYNNFGLTAVMTDPRGHQTTFDYIPSGSKTGLLGAVTERLVETWVQSTGSETAQDQITSFTYDTNGNPLTATSPAGVVTSYVADPLGRITDLYDPLGTRTGYAFDAMNRVTVQTTYTTKQTHPTVPNPFSGCVATQFVCWVDSVAPFRPALATTLLTRYTYTPSGTVDSILDPRNVKRKYVYDARLAVQRERDEFNADKMAYYNVNGLLDSIRSRTGFVTRYRYDGIGRRTAMIFPQRPSTFSGDGTVIPGDSLSYSYDLLGNLLAIRNAAGHTVTRSYWADGSVKSKTTVIQFTDSLYFEYDATGARTLMVGVGAKQGVALPAGRDSVRYFYGAVTGALDSMRVRIDSSGYANIVATRLFTFTYDGLGRRRQITYPVNGMTVQYAYDAIGTLRRVLSTNPAAATGATDRFDFTFVADSVDPIGRVMHQQTTCTSWYSQDTRQLPCGSAGSVRNLTSRYDRRGSLVFQLDELKRDSLHFDASGNIVYRYQSSGGSPGRDSMFVIANSNRMLYDTNMTSGARVNYGYDLDGARTRDSAKVTQGNSPLQRWEYYDALGRNTGFRYATFIDTTGILGIHFHPTRCTYDPDGQVSGPCPVDASFTTHDGPNASAMINGWRFVSAPGVDELLMGRYALSASYRQTIYFVMDGSGRQLAVGDSSGFLVDADFTVDRGAWQFAGATQNGSTFDANRMGSNDPPAVSYFRNRSYDSRTGRWKQEDPMGVASGLNLYQFNGNNPVTFTDPFGFCPWSGGRRDRNLDDCPKDGKGNEDKRTGAFRLLMADKGPEGGETVDFVISNKVTVDLSPGVIDCAGTMTQGCSPSRTHTIVNGARSVASIGARLVHEVTHTSGGMVAGRSREEATAHDRALNFYDRLPSSMRTATDLNRWSGWRAGNPTGFFNANCTGSWSTPCP